MNLERWLVAGHHPPVSPQHLFWAWVTIALSVLVAAGYVAVAFNWVFQSKLPERPESKASLRRLKGLVACGAVCGIVFYLTDMAWLGWRFYDVVLLFLGVRTWSFALAMRGPSLVNERLARVEELERTAEKFHEIAEHLPHMVWTATADGRVDFSNRSWAAYAGDGRTWLDAVHPEEREATLRWWADAVATREAMTREVRLAGAGGYRTFLVKVTPIVRGDAVKWLGACADIEDQKLLAAEKEMQAKQKTFFLNALSHDMRAPLNNVTLNAHLLKMSARDQEEVEIADLIVENAVAAGDLVTNLLEFAKAGAQEHNSADLVSLGGTMRQIVRRFQPIAERKGLYLRVRGTGDADVTTDRLKLERVVSNLVDNAIKYTVQGGVELELATREDGVAVRVTDTGIGIPPQNVPYLFDEFYQVNNHERDRSKGFGMGLAICRSLARQLGGDVRLARTGPEGSCFEFVVDAVRANRRRRPGGEAGDQPDSQAAGLCPV